MLARESFGVVALAVVIALFNGCQPANSPSGGGFPQETIPVPDDVGQYKTEAQPDGAVGGNGVEQLQSDVASALAQRGERAEADGALSATASWALSQVHQQRSVSVAALDDASRHYGFAGVVTMVAMFGTQQSAVWRDQLERTPRNMPITRYGIRVSPSGRSAAIVFGSSEVSYESIARAEEPGQTVTLKGEIGPRFTFGHVYLTKPDGTVQELKLPSRALNASFPLPDPGKYRLEVMGDGVTGPVVISNVPLYVGVPEPAVDGVQGTAVEPEQAEARMLVLLNEARKAAGVAPVVADAELRTIALAHSEDMAEHHFFGHVSPTTGAPADRMKRSGALVSISGENVASAPTPEEAHDGLMSSPGHRANMLRAEFTHVGIGATKGDGNLLVTMVFGRRPSASEVPSSAAQVEAAIAALRAKKGLAAATPDTIYRAGAQAGANALADGGNEREMGKALQAALQHEVERQRSSRPGACVQFTELLELSQLADIPALLSPSLRRMGVGAHLHEDGKGKRLSTVFMLEGVPCQ